MRRAVAAVLGPRDPSFRAFSAAQFVNMMGTGAYLVGATLYFTRVLGLTPAVVGVVLSVASLVGLVAAVPAGRLADRWGSRRVFLATQVLQCLAIAGLTVAHGLPAFLVCASAAALGQRAAVSSGGALVAELSQRDNRTVRRAYLRSVTNLGQAVGTLVAGIALADGSHTALRLLVAVNAASFGLGVLLLLRIPNAVDARPPGSRSRTTSGAALRNIGYVGVALLCGVLAVQYDVLAIAVPVYVATRTDAPLWLVSALVATNTVGIVVLQIRASRGVSGTRAASRRARLSGGVVGLALLVLGLAQFATSPLIAGVVLGGGVLVLTAGELAYGPASFELSYELAEEGRHGEYQGVFGLATGGLRAAAPFTVMFLCVQLGYVGWACLAALVLAASLAVVPASRRVARRRFDDVAHPRAAVA